MTKIILARELLEKEQFVGRAECCGVSIQIKRLLDRPPQRPYRDHLGNNV
jgi:hypothetical protein